MKICLDIRVSTKGGTSTFIDNFVRELHRIEHDHEIEYVFNAGTSALNGRHTRAAAVPFDHRILEFQWSQIALPRIIRRTGYDVYHSLKHVGPLRCPIRSVYRVPAVGQFNGTYPLPRLDRIYWTNFAGRAYKNADLLIAVSDYVKQGLIESLRIPEDRVVTIHNGIDANFRRLDASELRSEGVMANLPRPFILCAGNILPVKNFASVVQAYSLLSGEISDLPHLVMAGSLDDPHAAELKALVAEGNLEHKILFLGFQSPANMVQLYNQAMLLVHPSLHEGFSFTVLEAMACGLPIVASSTSSIPEAAGEAAVYCDRPTDAEALADCIRRVVDDPSLATALSERALQRAASFTWKHCVEKTLATYALLG